jgi:hypothetical protein
MRGGAIPLPLHPQRQFDHLLVVRYLGQPCKVQAPSKRDPYRIICGARAVSPGAHCRTAPLRSGRPKAMTAKGQTEKYSARADVFRCSPNSGHS